jgi:hypothetical protein
LQYPLVSDDKAKSPTFVLAAWSHANVIRQDGSEHIDCRIMHHTMTSGGKAATRFVIPAAFIHKSGRYRRNGPARQRISSSCFSCFFRRVGHTAMGVSLVGLK